MSEVKKTDFTLELLGVENKDIALSDVAKGIIANTRVKYQVINRSAIKIECTMGHVHYMNLALLRQFLTPSNSIARRGTVAIFSYEHKRIFIEISKSIKKARFLGLLPYPGQKYLFKNLV